MVKALNETFIVLIVYRSDSSIALEASNSVKKFLKKNIKSKGLKVIFIKMKLKNIFVIQNHNQILA